MIKNPLTIIAVFASIVEISGSIVLPNLEPEIQGLYVWFLMLFPSGLVAAFFVVLWFKNTVLYAPTDYRNDQSFMDTNTANPTTVNDVKVTTSDTSTNHTKSGIKISNGNF
ncbi:conserved hypothetical protein [Vibrio chagasii]|nr:conserved hypothetical protein [Vibrio chagasii]CAH7221305.1 conserved hypothetical protein [Vibrio chagasii]